MSPRYTFVAAILALACAPLAAQAGDLSILIKGSDTGSPLSGASLEVGGIGGSADMFGMAELSGVPPGPLEISAGFPGYVALDTTVVIEVGIENVVVLALTSEARDLGDVVVEAESINDAVLRRHGFFERRDRSTGVFLTREELDQRGTTLFADVFRAVPGIRLERDRAGRSVILSQRRRGCEMAIFFDGVEMAYGALNANAIAYDDIAAVEVYRGPAEVPSRFNYQRVRQTCGAILIWTRMVASNDYD